MAKVLVIVGGRSQGKTTILQWLKSSGFKQVDEPQSYSHELLKESIDRNQDLMIAISRTAFADLEKDEDFGILRRFHQVKVLKLYDPAP